MKKLLTAVIVVAIIVAMACTCPDNDAHQAAVKKEVKTAITDEMGKVAGSTITFYASLVTNLAANLAVDKMVDVKNYGILSVGTVTWGNDTHVVSVGAFGHVFPVGHEFMEKKLEEYLQEKIPVL